MAEKKEAAPAEAAAPKKKPNLLLPIIGVAMVVEAGAVFMLAKMMSPAPAAAGDVALEGAEAVEQPVEIQVLDSAFQNAATGRRWRWEIEVVAVVMPANKDKVDELLKARAASIKEGVGRIVGESRHGHLEDPTRSTIKRQLHSFLNEIFGVDGEDKPRIDAVLVPKLTGVVSDF